MIESGGLGERAHDEAAGSGTDSTIESHVELADVAVVENASEIAIHWPDGRDRPCPCHGGEDLPSGSSCDGKSEPAGHHCDVEEACGSEIVRSTMVNACGQERLGDEYCDRDSDYLDLEGLLSLVEYAR